MVSVFWRMTRDSLVIWRTNLVEEQVPRVVDECPVLGSDSVVGSGALTAHAFVSLAPTRPLSRHPSSAPDSRKEFFPVVVLHQPHIFFQRLLTIAFSVAILLCCSYSSADTSIQKIRMILHSTAS
mmetsp:Transcript_22665/g.52326  ORF Transcript_22665/g.52326 Transcript_22665/m.52326 type:complete len:125 (+) Transcript_22665:83-457(+)